MTRVQIASEGWGWLSNRDGIAQSNRPVTLTGTVYDSQTGGSPISTLVTDVNGRIPGYIEEGTYTLVTPSVTQTVEAVSGSKQAGMATNAATFPIDFSGATDGAAGLRAAIAATPLNGTLVIPRGVIKLQSRVDLTRAISIVGDGGGSATIVQGYDGTILKAAGTQGAVIALTANATIGDETLQLNTTGLVAGDYLRLYSTQLWVGSVNGATHGELVRIQSVNSGSQVTLGGPIGDSYSTANSASVRKLSYLTGIRIEGLTFQNPTPHTLTSIPYALDLSLLRGFRSEGCEFIQLDGPAYQVSDCLDFQIRDPDFRSLTNDPANNRFGYGVNVNNLSQDGLVHGAFMDSGRHLFTTGGGVGGGVPRHITVAHSFARNMRDPVTAIAEAAFDTHPEGEFITFDTNHVENSDAYAFKTRCPNTSFLNCHVRGVRGAGIYGQFESGQGNPINMIIDGGSIRDLTDYSGVPGRGVVCEGDGAQVKNLRIENTTYEGVYVGNPVNNTPNQNSLIDSVDLIAVGTTAAVGVNYNAQAASTGHRIRDLYVQGLSSGSPLATGVKTDTNVVVTSFGVKTKDVTSDFAGTGLANQKWIYQDASGNADVRASSTFRDTASFLGAVRVNSTSNATAFVEFGKASTDVAGTSTKARLFARDNGSGKTQLCVVFPTGAVQILATEP